jgi:hypothetical protein
VPEPENNDWIQKELWGVEVRSVTFKSVLWGVALRAGLDPSLNLQVNQAQALVEYINSRLREGWEWNDWPELCRIEERAFAYDYDPVVSYVAGDVVWSPVEREYYICVQAGTGQAVTDLNFWEPTMIEESERKVEHRQPGRTVIGTMFNIYSVNPDAFQNAREVEWVERSEGFLCGGKSKTVWCYFRLEPVMFTEEPYDASRTYQEGDLVYDAVTGEVYRAVTGSQGQPVSNVVFWELVRFPRVLAEYVKVAAYADGLREDGQQEKAQVEEARAEQIILSEWDKVSFQAGHVGRWKAVVA